MFKWYRKKYWDKKRFCKKYGHETEIEHFIGLHVGKQIMVDRYIKSCKHCNKIIEKTDTPVQEKPKKYGFSFGSEGVCSHCLNYDGCSTAPKPGKYNGQTFYPAYVLLYCPIDNFKGDESFYKKIKDDDTLLLVGVR